IVSEVIWSIRRSIRLSSQGAAALPVFGCALRGGFVLVSKMVEASSDEAYMSSRIPFHRPEIGEEEIAAATAVLRSGWLTTGEECRQFESEFAAFVGARHAVALNSCTGALHLALEATGCRQGDCVLVPTFTFAATAHVVTHLGATPLLVDSERDTL